MISLPPAASDGTSDVTSDVTSDAATDQPAAGHAQATGGGRPLGASGRRSRSGLRTLAAGTIVVLLAFVTVQAGGCGFKTPLQMPKKAAPAKPAS